MRKKIGQQLIMGIQGSSLSSDEASFIVNNNIGGVILFGRNIESPVQVHELTAEIQSLRTKMIEKAPLIVAIDMEGGRVARLKAPFTQWPEVSALGKIGSTSVAFKFAQAMGEELSAIGVNLNFAPCIDVLTNPANRVIGDRSLGADPEAVSRLGSALVRGYIKSGIIPCAKHFPGHGNTLVDSHDDLPVEIKSFEELEKLELEPFKKVFRARLDLVMSAHIKFSSIDPDWPVTLSEVFLKEILRDRLRFRNMIITDDLDMKALTHHFDKATIAVRALQAGANMLLYCNQPDSPAIAMDAIEAAISTKALSPSVVEDNYRRVLELKKNMLAKVATKSFEDASRIIAHPDHLRLAKAIVAGTVPADLLSQTA